MRKIVQNKERETETVKEGREKSREKSAKRVVKLTEGEGEREKGF